MYAQCKVFGGSPSKVEMQVNDFLREKRLSRDQVELTMAATGKEVSNIDPVYITLLYDGNKDMERR